MFSHQHRKAKLLFGLSDIVLVALAFEAAYQTRLSLTLSHTFFFSTEKKALVLGLCVVTWVAVGYWLDIYGNLGSGELRVVLKDSLRQSAYAVLGLIVAEFALRLDLSRPFISFITVYTWALLLVFRIGARPLLGIIRREFGALRYVVVVGIGERARKLGQSLEAAYDQGIRLRGFVAPEEASAYPAVALTRNYPVHALTQLPLLLRREVIDEVLFAVESETLGSLEDVFLLCDEEGVRTRVAVDFFPHVNSEMHLERWGKLHC